MMMLGLGRRTQIGFRTNLWKAERYGTNVVIQTNFELAPFGTTTIVKEVKGIIHCGRHIHVRVEPRQKGDIGAVDVGGSRAFQFDFETKGLKQAEISEIDFEMWIKTVDGGKGHARHTVLIK